MDTRPLGTCSDYVVDELSEDLATLKPRLLATHAAELACGAIPLLSEADLNEADLRVAHLDLHMLGASLRKIDSEEPHDLLLAQSLANEKASLAPGLTYQDLILSNPPDDLRQFLRGSTGESEALFYEVHREIERQAGLAILGLQNNTELSAIASNFEAIVGQMRRFLTELPPRDFATMRPFYGNPDGIPGPSAKFSAGIATLDATVLGFDEKVRRKIGKKLEEEHLFSNTSAHSDGFAGLVDIKSAMENPPDLSDAERGVLANHLIEFRKDHLRVVARFLPGVLLGTAGEPIKRYLNDMRNACREALKTLNLQS